MFKILDLFFALRPTLLFPFWTLILAGVRLAGGSRQPGTIPWLLLSISLSSLFGLIYLLNQLRDVETDRCNRKLLLVSEGLVPKSQLIVLAVIMGIVSFGGLYLSGFGNLGWWAGVFFIIVGILYNWTPAALEYQPWGSLAAGLSTGWLLCRMGEAIAGEQAGLMREAPYILAFASAWLLTELPDVKGDREAGKITFTVRWGLKTTMLVGAIGIIVALLGAIWNRDWVIALPALITAPAFIAAWRSSNSGLAVKANKAAIFILSLAVGWYFPIYIAVILIYYPLARWYYRRRFNLAYPSFKAD